MSHFMEFGKKHTINTDISQYDDFKKIHYNFGNYTGNKKIKRIKRKTKYNKYILSKKWKKKTRKIKRVCWVCGSEKNIGIHHITYKRLYNEKQSDLVPLCWECHNEVHNIVLNEKVKLEEAHIVYKNLYYLENDIRYK